MSAPRFHRVCAGDYETRDGVFRLLQLDGGATRAWNVEWTNEFEHHLIYEMDFNGPHDMPGYPVDGAATKRDALVLFADWWEQHGHPDPDWTKP